MYEKWQIRELGGELGPDSANTSQCPDTGWPCFPLQMLSFWPVSTTLPSWQFPSASVAALSSFLCLAGFPSRVATGACECSQPAGMGRWFLKESRLFVLQCLPCHSWSWYAVFSIKSHSSSTGSIYQHPLLHPAFQYQEVCSLLAPSGRTGRAKGIWCHHCQHLTWLDQLSGPDLQIYYISFTLCTIKYYYVVKYFQVHLVVSPR